MDLGLTGARCLVSGGSRGIGRAIALALAGEGARVAVVARGEADLATLATELAGRGADHHTLVADVAGEAGPATTLRARFVSKRKAEDPA